MEVRICERFHKWPEELDKIDVGRLMRGLKLQDVYNIAKKQQSGAQMTGAESDLLGRILQMELDGN